MISSIDLFFNRDCGAGAGPVVELPNPPAVDAPAVVVGAVVVGVADEVAAPMVGARPVAAEGFDCAAFEMAGLAEVAGAAEVVGAVEVEALLNSPPNDGPEVAVEAAGCDAGVDAAGGAPEDAEPKSEGAPPVEVVLAGWEDAEDGC